MIFLIRGRILLKREKMIRLMVFQMFELDLLHDPRRRRFNKFILHLQNWIGSVQPSFVELEADMIDERQLNII